MEASREMEEQLGMRRKDEKEYKGKEKNKEKKEEVLDEIIKVYDGYNSLRKRLFRTITVSKSATKDELLHASMKAFVVTQVIMAYRQNIKILGLPTPTKGYKYNIWSSCVGISKLLPA